MMFCHLKDHYLKEKRKKHGAKNLRFRYKFPVQIIQFKLLTSRHGERLAQLRKD